MQAASSSPSVSFSARLHWVTRLLTCEAAKTRLLFTSLHLLAARLARSTLTLRYINTDTQRARNHARIVFAGSRVSSLAVACVAKRRKSGKSRFYTPVSTSLAMFSSIFLSILSQGSRRSLCVAPATEQEAEGEALSSAHQCIAADKTPVHTVSSVAYILQVTCASFSFNFTFVRTKQAEKLITMVSLNRKLLNK